MPAAEISASRLPGSGVGLHAVTAGDPAGPPVVLLHGFPEFWYGWKYQIGPLAAAGFRVVAIDQRGYNLSDKPSRIADYAIDRLAEDVLGCLDAIGARKAAIVGHDWGGAVAWWLGMRHAERVSKLAVLNCPHPLAMQAALESSWEQVARSWYMFAAQVPGGVEWLARATNYGTFERVLRRGARGGTFTHDDLTRYREAWSQPGAVTGMTNWYRAAFRHRPRLESGTRVRVPTLLIWGSRDRFLCRALASMSAARCDGVELGIFPRAGHWVQREEPERVNARLVEFLNGQQTAQT